MVYWTATRKDNMTVLENMFDSREKAVESIKGSILYGWMIIETHYTNPEQWESDTNYGNL